MSRRSVSNLADFAAWAEHRFGGKVGGAPRRLVYAGPDPQYGIGLDGTVPGYAIACIEASPAAEILRAEGIDVYTLDARADLRQVAGAAARRRNTAALLSEASLYEWLNSMRRGGPRDSAAKHEPAPQKAASPELLVFKTSHAIEQRCAEMGWNLLASPAVLSRRWENKVAFAKIAEALDLPRPKGLNFDPGSTGYANLRGSLGDDVVIQAPHGYSGAKTWRVRSRAEFDAVRPKMRGRRLRASAYRPGLPVTLNACVTGKGVACSAPFIQITGEPLLTPHRLGSCGNDWSSARRIGDVSPFLLLAERIGQRLAEEGFLGIFGVDFVLTADGEVLVIEVNPRLVASIALFTQLELRAGRLPLLARHLMAFLDPAADIASLSLHQDPVEGSQLILHNLVQESRQVHGKVEGGNYALDELQRFWLAQEENLELSQSQSQRSGAGPTAEGVGKARTKDAAPMPKVIRSAVRIDADTASDEVLVLAPAQGEVVTGGSAFGRIQLPGAATGEDGELLPELRAAVGWMRYAARLAGRDFV